MRNENGRGGVAGTSQPEIEKKLNDRIVDIMNKYAIDGTIYLGDLPDSAIPIMTAIFTDVINKKTADEIYAKYKQQLTMLWVTVETMAKMHGNILIVASEWLNGTQDVTMEVVDLWLLATWVWAGFQLGRFVIFQIVKKGTGALITRSVVWAWWAAYLQYEATMVAKWGYVMVDSLWNFIRLTKGDMTYWFEHIWTFVRSTWKTRVQEILTTTRKLWIENAEKELGFTLDGPYAFQKLMEKIIRNWQRLEQSGLNSDKWLYEATIWWRKWWVTVFKDNSTVTTLLNPY